MFNSTTVASVFAAAACALVIAFFIIGMGVNSSWAGSATGNYSKRIITAQGCIPNGLPLRIKPTMLRKGSPVF